MTDLAAPNLDENRNQQQQLEDFQRDENAIRKGVWKLLVGQGRPLSELLVVLLAGGHALLEGVPGTGKTMLVRAIAKTVGVDFNRIQFTPDLLPADILGCDTLIDGGSSNDRIEFRQGPVFTQFLLADEINRGTPRTQSALLESMQERAVTIGGERHKLDSLFSVFATRNPIEMEGTYPLPEAQLDRFLMEIHLKPSSAEEMVLIADRTTKGSEPEIPQVIDSKRLHEMRAQVRQVIASHAVTTYAARLVRATQPDSQEAPPVVRENVRYGAGVRALQSLVLCGKVEALRQGRMHLSTQDLESYLLPTLRHRIILSLEGESRGIEVEELINEIVRRVQVEGT